MKNRFLFVMFSTISLLLPSISNAAISFNKSEFQNNVAYAWNNNDDFLLKYITDNNEDTFHFAEVAYNRGKPYRDYIVKKAREYNLPDEIFALAGVESSYLINARSKSGAIGMWQFMTPTAREMGLINGRVDDRRDWKKSTDAAMKYLAHLRDDHFYGDLELSILAYNAGLGKVKRAIEKHQSVDVWYLIKDNKIFKQESIDYLPKFIAYFNLYQILDGAGDKKVVNTLAVN